LRELRRVNIYEGLRRWTRSQNNFCLHAMALVLIGWAWMAQRLMKVDLMHQAYGDAVNLRCTTLTMLRMAW
jgi:hypothetical protein